MKKRLFGLILTSVMLLTLLPLTAVAAPAATELEGGGTEENPYLIEDETDLKNFADIVNSNPTGTYEHFYQLTADIDLSNSGDWQPISAFYGTLYGGGHKIKLVINGAGGVILVL